MNKQNQKPETIQQMFQKVRNQLLLTLKALDFHAATRAIGMAEQIMGKIEGLALSNPMITLEDLSAIVGFTRGSLWVQAREHVSRLMKVPA